MTEPAEQALLQLDQVSLAIRGKPVLQDVSLTVSRGEIVTLIGPNGAGKTTLLRVALKLIRPDTGAIWQQAGLQIGYMPQRLTIDSTFPLDVRRFLLLAGRFSDEQLQTRLEEVGATGLFRSPLHGLSGGELQRVLLARALLREPALLILDEPIQGVDVHGQTEIFRLLSTIRDRRGCAILMVSHDLHLVMASTDRVICLNRHICCTGSPEQVTRDEDFLKMFGPAATQALAIYSHDQQHRHGNCHHDDGGKG